MKVIASVGSSISIEGNGTGLSLSVTVSPTSILVDSDLNNDGNIDDSDNLQLLCEQFRDVSTGDIEACKQSCGCKMS